MVTPHSCLPTLLSCVVQRNGDAAPSIAVLIKGNRTPGETSLMNCFRGAGGAAAPVDSRALLFFVNDLCALTIEAARRHVRALAPCVDDSLAWSLPQITLIAGKDPIAMGVEDRRLVASLALRAHVGTRAASIGSLIFQGGIVTAALADLATSGISPGAEACAARVRAEFGLGGSGPVNPFFMTMEGFVRELAALAAWLEAFDPTTTLAVPARSIEEGAWIFSQDDAPCGKILAMPGTCGIAGSARYAPVGPVLVRSEATKAPGDVVPRCGVPESAVLRQEALVREWGTSSNAMGAVAVLPVAAAPHEAGRR